MAKIFCKYHPAVPARWVCRHCQIDYCSSCTPKPENKLKPECPVCHRDLDSLGAGNMIEPFWHRIPQFFIYPAHLPTMIVMVALVLISLLVSGSIMGFLLQLAMGIVFLKYAYVVLEHSAEGFLKPKPLKSEELTTELELPFKQILVIFAVVSANSFIAETFGVGMFTITMSLTILMFPASVMVLAVEHSFFAAFNPIIVLATIKRIGPSYLVLCLFLFLLVSGSWLVQDMAADVLPKEMFLPVSSFVDMYFTLIMFSMMGYVIYQYHEKLGFYIEQEFDEATGKKVNANSSSSSQRAVEILLQEGKTEDAELQLRQQIKEYPNDLQTRHQYHKLLIMMGDKEKIRQADSEFISRLLHESQMTFAIQVFVESRKIVPEFRPGNAQERLKLAQAMANNGMARQAVSLLSNLHKDFPNYEDTPKAYLLVAKLLCEQFNEDKKAQDILNFVTSKYPHHPLIAEIKNYLDIIKRVTAH